MNYCFLNPLFFFLNYAHNKPVNNLNPSAEHSSMFLIRAKSQEEKNAIKKIHLAGLKKKTLAFFSMADTSVFLKTCRTECILVCLGSRSD